MCFNTYIIITKNKSNNSDCSLMQLTPFLKIIEHFLSNYFLCHEQDHRIENRESMLLRLDIFRTIEWDKIHIILPLSPTVYAKQSYVKE